MPVILNFSNGSVLPENELEALRHIARSNQNDTITIGGRNMRLHYIQFMDGFSVEPIPGWTLGPSWGKRVSSSRRQPGKTT